MRHPLAFVVLAVPLAACSSNGGPHELFVDLETDYRPAIEFTAVRVEVFPQGGTELIASRDHAVGRDEDYDRGQRVAEFPEIPRGDISVRVQLLRGGDSVDDRVWSFALTRDKHLPVRIDRECAAVTCPGAGDPPTYTECDRGTCVPPTCGAEMRDTCPDIDPECEVDEDCGAGSECATGVCLEGVCSVEADDSLCAEGEWCNPDGGCETLPCIPATCEEAGAECGSPPDGCGETLDCGACAGSEVCGALETFQCATPPPTDDVPPTVSILRAPPDPSSGTSVSITFTGSDTGGSGLARYECRLDGSSWSTCTSPQGYSGLSNGSHEFEVRAWDGAGNVSAAATAAWVVDTGGPVVAIAPIADPAPSDYDATVDVGFTYTCSDAGGSGCVASSRICTVDGVEVSCSWMSGTIRVGKDPAAFTFGDHNLRVTVRDAAGNVGADTLGFTVTRCARRFQYPSHTSDGFTRGGCCAGLVDSSSWKDGAMWHPRGDGSCRAPASRQAQGFECRYPGAGCSAPLQTTEALLQDMGLAGCAGERAKRVCVSDQAEAQHYCGTDGGSGDRTPVHGRAGEGWHPPPSAGCEGTGTMSSSSIMRRACAEDTCWAGTVDRAHHLWSLSSSESCDADSTKLCRSNPPLGASSVACICLDSASSPVHPYADDGRG